MRFRRWGNRKQDPLLQQVRRRQKIRHKTSVRVWCSESNGKIVPNNVRGDIFAAVAVVQRVAFAKVVDGLYVVVVKSPDGVWWADV